VRELSSAEKVGTGCYTYVLKHRISQNDHYAMKPKFALIVWGKA